MFAITTSWTIYLANVTYSSAGQQLRLVSEGQYDLISIGTRYLANSKTNGKRRPLGGSRGRLGIAIVEMALVLPIFVTIALATIDTCRVIYIRHSAKIAAYECARIAVIPGATDDDLQTQCDAIMTERKLKDHSFVLSQNLGTLVKGELLRVTVSIPADSNWFNQSWFYKNSNFDESVTIMVD